MRKSDIIKAIFNNSPIAKNIEYCEPSFRFDCPRLITDKKSISSIQPFEKQIIPPYEGVHPVTGEKIQIDSHIASLVSSNKIKSSQIRWRIS